MASFFFWPSKQKSRAETTKIGRLGALLGKWDVNGGLMFETEAPLYGTSGAETGSELRAAVHEI